MYGHKKSRYSTAACAPSENFVVAANVRKVFGTCKGEGRKCVAEHVFCGKRKGSRKSMKTCFRCNEKSRTSFEVTGFKIGLRVYLYW